MLIMCLQLAICCDILWTTDSPSHALAAHLASLAIFLLCYLQVTLAWLLIYGVNAIFKIFQVWKISTSIRLSGWWSCYSTPPFCIGFFPFLGIWEWAYYKSSVTYNLVRLFLSTNHHGQWKWIPCLCWQAPRCTLPSTQEMTVSKSLWSVIDSLAHHMTWSSGQDPLIHYSWHFGWTVHLMCSIHTVITKGLIHAAKISELQLDPEEALDDE